MFKIIFATMVLAAGVTVLPSLAGMAWATDTSTDLWNKKNPVFFDTKGKIEELNNSKLLDKSYAPIAMDESKYFSRYEFLHILQDVYNDNIIKDELSEIDFVTEKKGRLKLSPKALSVETKNGNNFYSLFINEKKFDRALSSFEDCHTCPGTLVVLNFTYNDGKVANFHSQEIRDLGIWGDAGTVVNVKSDHSEGIAILHDDGKPGSMWVDIYDRKGAISEKPEYIYQKVKPEK